MHITLTADCSAGNWKDSESQKSGSPLDDRFHGAWGEDSNHQQDPSTSQPLFKAAVSGKGPLLGEQIAGPIGAGRHMDDNSSTQAIKSDPYESSERSVNPVAGDTLEAAPGQTPSGVIYNPAENPEGISGHPQVASQQSPKSLRVFCQKDLLSTAAMCLDQLCAFCNGFWCAMPPSLNQNA